MYHVDPTRMDPTAVNLLWAHIPRVLACQTWREWQTRGKPTPESIKQVVHAMTGDLDQAERAEAWAHLNEANQ